MKKVTITTLAIVMAMGFSTYTFANTSTKPEVSKEELTYLKSINPSITSTKVDSLMKQRNQLDELHKQTEKLELDYGILVDNTKDPNKEPKILDDLTAEQREKHFQLIDKIWSEELRFLDAQYKAGLIKEDDYKLNKRNFEYLREKNSLNNAS
ncbi:hypothetical protein [Paenibacillus macquariensis]|uniref:Uncharacterized protein n=1 Tax=Paenibacillus macquariensis TaxID=948756 RepID=A0ABY1KGA7_9BACL|nr:hypothetical protein [Paenibacillus macquariensis]SIR68956.1 hypothetical protein SAMN05421578_1347 [Paenibacillus macquariensis]